MMVVPIRCSPVVGASPAAAAEEEEPGCTAAMAGAARSAAVTLVGSGEEAERSEVVCFGFDSAAEVRSKSCIVRRLGLPRKKEKRGRERRRKKRAGWACQ
jgi:hypothetical protein